MGEQRHPTAEAAEAAFYYAFEQGDLDAMMALWAADGNVTCVHPGATVLQGRDAVEAGWRQIFGAPERLRFRIEPLQRLVVSGLAVHVVHEHITLPGESEPRAPVVVVNAYRQTPEGWRMVLHHAAPPRGTAPEPPPATVH